jgi:hypothetical protein
VKIANRWLIPRDVLEEFAKTYVPKVGHPRTKRKYTKRSPKCQGRWESVPAGRSKTVPGNAAV